MPTRVRNVQMPLRASRPHAFSSTVGLYSLIGGSRISDYTNVHYSRAIMYTVDIMCTVVCTLKCHAAVCVL